MKVINGNNIDLLKQYPDNYFDAVVTDPPYGLGKEPIAEEVMKDWIEKGYHEISGSGFMGKEWDAFIPQPIFWKEVFRVLKHGGHVLAFYGTRTYDWGVMSMRFAGFEVRDCIQWVYGSGFPKSHNISKAIDKFGGDSLDWFIDYILEVAKERGISKKELTILFPSKNGNPTGWLWNKQNNQSITIEQYNTLKEFLGLSFPTIEEAKREVIGKGVAGLTKGNIANFSGETEFDITAPSTENAKKWEGWGSALKPANEPVVLARKPLEKGLSIAENVLKWGTGGINIDGCRVNTNDNLAKNYNSIRKSDDEMGERGYKMGFRQGKDSYAEATESTLLGRFPANLILTHHPECELKGLKKVGTGKDGGYNYEGNVYEVEGFVPKNSPNANSNYGQETIEHWECHEDCPIRIMDEQSGDKSKSNNLVNDSGGSSRFFYCAKASKSERNNGLPEQISNRITPMSGRGQGGLKCKICNKWKNSGNPCTCDIPEFEEIKFNSTPNFNGHPTVKPVKLMQYLVRMVTPPNGIVLDPFCGSGTTGIACKLEGFDFVGMEQDAEYCKIAEARIMNYKEEPEEPLEFIEEEDKPRVIQQSLF